VTREADTAMEARGAVEAVECPHTDSVMISALVPGGAEEMVFMAGCWGL